MSQKKVDAYKEQKANRKEILKKEKRMLMIEKIIGIVVCFAVACWVGYSVYEKVTDTTGKEVEKVDTVIDTSALDEYASSLNTTEDDSLVVEPVEDADAEDTVVEADEAETEEAETAETEAAETEAAKSEAAETDTAETIETETTETKATETEAAESAAQDQAE